MEVNVKCRNQIAFVCVAEKLLNEQEVSTGKIKEKGEKKVFFRSF